VWPHHPQDGGSDHHRSSLMTFQDIDQQQVSLPMIQRAPLPLLPSFVAQVPQVMSVQSLSQLRHCRAAAAAL